MNLLYWLFPTVLFIFPQLQPAWCHHTCHHLHIASLAVSPPFNFLIHRCNSNINPTQPQGQVRALPTKGWFGSDCSIWISSKQLFDDGLLISVFSSLMLMLLHSFQKTLNALAFKICEHTLLLRCHNFKGFILLFVPEVWLPIPHFLAFCLKKMRRWARQTLPV